MAAISAVAEYPERITDLFLNDEANALGEPLGSGTRNNPIFSNAPVTSGAIPLTPVDYDDYDNAQPVYQNGGF